MRVMCPECLSIFNLPEFARPGVRLHCTVCDHIFVLSEPDGESAGEPEIPEMADKEQRVLGTQIPERPAGDIAFETESMKKGGPETDVEAGGSAKEDADTSDAAEFEVAAGFGTIFESGGEDESGKNEEHGSPDAPGEKQSNSLVGTIQSGDLSEPAESGKKSNTWIWVLVALLLVGLVCYTAFSGSGSREKAPGPEKPAVSAPAPQVSEAKTGEPSAQGASQGADAPAVVPAVNDGAAAEKKSPDSEPSPAVAPASSDDVDSLTMQKVRQYFVDNSKGEKILVVEGVVVNQSTRTRSNISLEASIYGPDKTATQTKQQSVGVRLSSTQLESMAKPELEAALSNPADIAATNSKVQPGGEVPFMILFYAPPADVAEFGVRILSAQTVVGEGGTQGEAAPEAN